MNAPRGCGRPAGAEELRCAEIVSGVFTWPWFSAPHGYNFNGYLIADPGGNICVDPVEPDAEALAEIARRGVARIIVTNRNHVRAANRVRAATGARTAIHPDDAAYARSQGAELDDELHAGDDDWSVDRSSRCRASHRAKLRSIGRSGGC